MKPDGSIVLCDLALAKTVHPGNVCSGLTTTSAPISVRWGSPEILRSHGLRTLESDVWALACCALEVSGLGYVYSYNGDANHNQIIDDSGPFSAHAGQTDFIIASKILAGQLPSSPTSFERIPGIRTLAAVCWHQEPSERPVAAECGRFLSELVSQNIDLTELDAKLAL